MKLNHPKIEILENGDLDKFVELINLFAEVFEMENFKAPPEEHLKNLLVREDFFAFVALIEGKVAGGLTVYTLEQYYSIRPLAYLYDLAVEEKFQRKGIGKRLIDEALNFFKEKGYEELFVQADKEDAHALDFYRSTRPTAEEEVSLFYYLLKK